MPAILLLCAAWIAAWVLIDRWESQPSPTFFADGIGLLAWYALALLGLAALLRWRSRPAPVAGGALLLALGAVPLPLCATVLALFLNPPWRLGLYALVAIYLLLYLARGLRAFSGQSQRGAAFAGLLFIAGFAWLTDTLNVIPDVWTPQEATAAAPEGAIDAEAILFDQSARIDEALEAVSRGAGAGPSSSSGRDSSIGRDALTDHDPPTGRGLPSSRDGPTSPKAFFLGFAGVGDEKVFAEEIGLASRILGQRYAIGDRGLSLINDERDLDRGPLATVSGLNYALQGLGSLMNVDRDVLILSISSHGSKDPAIVVDNSKLPLDDLTAADLSAALRESGIKWRVIIISACYAGGFIESLRNPQTIVITAAAADRTSFGCSNDRDLTYFGEAFYRDALPGAASLREAFETAKRAVAAREHQESFEPSNPQAYFGADMEAKLAALEPKLATTASKRAVLTASP